MPPTSPADETRQLLLLLMSVTFCSASVGSRCRPGWPTSALATAVLSLEQFTDRTPKLDFRPASLDLVSFLLWQPALLFKLAAGDLLFVAASVNFLFSTLPPEAPVAFVFPAGGGGLLVCTTGDADFGLTEVVLTAGRLGDVAICRSVDGDLLTCFIVELVCGLAAVVSDVVAAVACRSLDPVLPEVLAAVATLTARALLANVLLVNDDFVAGFARPPELGLVGALAPLPTV